MAEDDGTDSNEGLGDSPYRSPTTSVGGVVGDGSGDIMSAFLGPKNTEFYQQAFARFASGGGAISWHWPACLVTWFWLAYRKMWVWFFVYFLVWPFALYFIAVAAAVVHPVLPFLTQFVGLFVIPPLFANRLYYGHAKNKVAKAQFAATDAQSQALEAARLGGTSNILVVLIPAVIVLVGILAAIAIPAYQDYTIRAQVSEGLNLSGGVKAAVTTYYLDNDHMPSDNSTAGLAAAQEISGKYTQSVSVDDGQITITFGNDAHLILVDNELHLVPSGGVASVEWECSSPNIAAKHLPAACR